MTVRTNQKVIVIIYVCKDQLFVETTEVHNEPRYLYKGKKEASHSVAHRVNYVKVTYYKRYTSRFRYSMRYTRQ